MISYMHRKESIVLTTIDLMNEFGVQALSTREVARREGITEGAVFKHYPKKTDLLIAVLDYYTKYDQDIMDSIRLKKLDPKEAIIYFIEIFSTYYQSYPAITSINQALDEMRYKPELENKVKLIFNNRLEFITSLIEEGQKKGDISIDLDKTILADIIMGAFHEICLRWRLNDYDFSLKDRCLNAIKIILNC